MDGNEVLINDAPPPTSDELPGGGKSFSSHLDLNTDSHFGLGSLRVIVISDSALKTLVVDELFECASFALLSCLPFC